MENYKKLYEKLTNKKVPLWFDIHHIDMNRQNNNIENLIAIPKQLHKDLHKINFDIKVDLNFNKDIFTWNWYSDFVFNEIIKWKNVYDEYYKWLAYKSFLLWEIRVNIYNYKY